jgi:purine-nucleoside/S-methyl-5'-thioadenosine phosphorylase / adenosine deaminase
VEWKESEGVESLQAELPGARVAFSTRSAGSVRESRAPLAAALGLAPERIAFARQVHGAELAFHGERRAEVPEADGHVLSCPGLAALVFVADCLPVALAGPGGVAILHCGWRGLVAGIVARGAAAVQATDAAIGPGIGGCCYRVGDEVLGAFAGLGEGVAMDGMLDLAEAARRLLVEAGVERIEAAGICTSCDDRFFSHRRDGGGTGRQAGVAWLEGEAG